MARIRVIAVSLVLVLGCWTAVITRALAGEQVNFTLAQGQAILVGSYVIQFSGINAGAAAYNVYLAGGGLLAQFPSHQPSPNQVYIYDNISIETRSVTPDRMLVTGAVWVR